MGLLKLYNIIGSIRLISTYILATEEDKEQVGKVRPVLDVLEKTFPACYKLGKNTSVDESMIAYSAVLGFLQYIPMKPIKKGIRLWARSCSETGYMDWFNVYLGQRECYPKGLGHHIVSNLTDGIQRSNGHLYMDNFFTSCQLFSDPLENGLYACGTTQPQWSGFPQLIDWVEFSVP